MKRSDFCSATPTLASSALPAARLHAAAADDPAQRIRATYGGNYERLVALKRRYDSTNLFQRNANIPPG